MNNTKTKQIIAGLPDPVDGMNHHLMVSVYSRFGRASAAMRMEIADLKALAAAVPEWVPVADGILPQRREGVRYSQVPCLVTHQGEVKVLVYNHEHAVWDDETGDDFYCQISDVTAWMPLPEPFTPYQEDKDDIEEKIRKVTERGEAMLEAAYGVDFKDHQPR